MNIANLIAAAAGNAAAAEVSGSSAAAARFLQLLRERSRKSSQHGHEDYQACQLASQPAASCSRHLQVGAPF